MRYRTFGDSDVTASEVGFGMWTVSTGWWGDAVRATAAVLSLDAVTSTEQPTPPPPPTTDAGNEWDPWG